MPSPPLIFAVHRNSTGDGPGIRTAVFLKGCPLRCAWCHNPESQQTRREVWHLEQRCRRCGACVAACPQQGITDRGEGLHIDQDACTGCGTCAAGCPAQAMEAIGSERTIASLADEAARDRVWYESSGGGVTVSGGEPAAFPEFSAALLTACRDRGLHTAVDTCGHVRESAFSTVIQAADLVLFDCKHHDSERHRAWTGAGLERIVANLRLAAQRARTGACGLWIRTPLIPGATADPAVIAGIASLLLHEAGDAISRWELCAFNPGCQGKYRRLGRGWACSDSLMGGDTCDALLEVARRCVADRFSVFLTGLRRDHLQRTA